MMCYNLGLLSELGLLHMYPFALGNVSCGLSAPRLLVSSFLKI